MDVIYPHITVKLVGTDGNAFSIISKICTALKANHVAPTDIKAFQNEAMSGDYNNLLATCQKYVNVR